MKFSSNDLGEYEASVHHISLNQLLNLKHNHSKPVRIVLDSSFPVEIVTTKNTGITTEGTLSLMTKGFLLLNPAEVKDQSKYISFKDVPRHVEELKAEYAKPVEEISTECSCCTSKSSLPLNDDSPETRKIVEELADLNKRLETVEYLLKLHNKGLSLPNYEGTLCQQ